MARKKISTPETEPQTDETLTPTTTPDTDLTTPTTENAEQENNSEPELSDEDIVRALVGDATDTSLDEAMQKISETHAPIVSEEDKERFQEILDNAIEDSTLTHDELNEKYAPTIQEGINFLFSAINSRGHAHQEQMLSLLKEIEKISNF